MIRKKTFLHEKVRRSHKIKILKPPALAEKSANFPFKVPSLHCVEILQLVLRKAFLPMKRAIDLRD